MGPGFRSSIRTRKSDAGLDSQDVRKQACLIAAWVAGQAIGFLLSRQKAGKGGTPGLGMPEGGNLPAENV